MILYRLWRGRSAYRVGLLAYRSPEALVGLKAVVLANNRYPRAAGGESYAGLDAASHIANRAGLRFWLAMRTALPQPASQTLFTATLRLEDLAYRTLVSASLW